MPHIFISYAKKDTKSLAIDLANQFNVLKDVTAWVDVEGIDYGDEWETLIQRQIARCDYMVVLYSPDINRHIDDESQTESYVIKEIRYAQMRKKPIIPVMAQETHPPINLNGIHHIEYVKEGLTPDELLNRLCKRMKIVHILETSTEAIIASPDILEIKEIISEIRNQSSYEIGELISDGWIILSYDFDDKYGAYLCSLGRPKHIKHIKRTSADMAMAVIKSGRYSEYCIDDTICGVKDCTNTADYEVMLYDYYPETNNVFFERHQACGFICEEHMIVNESEATGVRKPRSVMSYPRRIIPYHHAQGYIKYLPAKYKFKLSAD